MKNSDQLHLLTVKEMAADEQPREKMKRFGVSSLSNAELFAIILRTGATGYPITALCRDLMRANDNLFLNLERKSREEIQTIKGVGETKSMQIEAVMEIVRRYQREKLGQRIKVASASTVFDVMRPEIANLPHEEMWAIFLNQANQIIGMYRSSEGGTAVTVCDIKKIIRQALLARAEALILCHNHPSGNLQVSPQDDNVTRKMKEACSTLDLRFLDHVVVTTDGFYSYRDSSRIL